MRDSQHGGQADRGGAGLTTLARTIVAKLVSRDDLPARPLDPRIVAALSETLVSPDPTAFEAFRTDLRRHRITDSELVDSYFPAAARLLGCQWVEDRLPFTDVTIGVARMQSFLRQVGREWASVATADPDRATVLLILPSGEQHTFGAMVLAGQLRRRGISVQLQIGADLPTLAALAGQQAYDCAMISVACEEKLEFCGKVVKALKAGSEGRIWVAVGGAVLDRDVDVKGMTAADVVTNDPLVAIEGARIRMALPERVIG